VHGADRCGAQVVEHEVTVGDGVERVLHDSVEAERARNRLAARVPVDSGQCARTERQVGGRAGGVGKSLQIAAEHPEIREQMVREVHRLRALEVGVARHLPVRVALGELSQRGHQVDQAAARLRRLLAHEQRHVGRHLVVSRARGVHLAADRSGDLREAALDGHVDVLVVGQELERLVLQLTGDLIEAPAQLVRLLRGEDAGLCEHRHVGL
jgi:hypothetical protein